MNFIELQTAIILIEGEYPREERNTAPKMVALIEKEFGEKISEEDINQFYGLSQDYERINRQIEYESRYW